MVGEEEKGPNEVKLMQEDNLEEGNLEASAVKEEPKLRFCFEECLLFMHFQVGP